MQRPVRVLAVLALASSVSACSCGGDDPEDADLAIELPGLSAPVMAYTDAEGVTHLKCETDDDCVAAEGYVHASQRFFQMDLRRRLARGRLSLLAGSVTVETDKEWRRIMTSRDGRPLEEVALEGADARTVAALEAYSRGVNAWLADAREERNGATLAIEYDFALIDKEGALTTEWEPLDSAACALPLVRELSDTSDFEIALGEVYATLAPEVARDLFGMTTPSPSTTLARTDRALGPSAPRVTRGAPPRGGAPSDGAAVRARLAPVRALLAEARGERGLERLGKVGSNNWVVGPSKAGGKALLANDPHLALSHPAIWYMVHLDAVSEGSGTLDIAGMSFAGLPGIILGQNADIAWGATTTYFDQSDIYVETMNGAGDAVVFDGEEVPVIAVDYEIGVSFDDPVPFPVKVVPHHGPILSEDEDAGTALSMRWTGHDISTDLNFLFALATATSVAEAKVALETVTTLSQNFVVIDRGGAIGWFPYNRLPKRPWASEALAPWLPLPGDGSAEWDGYYGLDELPQAEDPANGFVATANNDMTGALADGDPSNDDGPLQFFADPGFRHERIVQRLEERDDHDLASMQAIQADVHSLPGERITPTLLADAATVTLDADAELARAALAAWDFECPSGLADHDPDGEPAADAAARASAAGCAAFHVVMAKLRHLVFDDDTDAVDLPALDGALLNAFLAADRLSRAYWDDLSTDMVTETRADIVAAALSQAGAFLKDELGPTVDAWLWGRIHTIALRADLFDQAGVTDYNTADFARGGGAYVIDVGDPEDELHDEYAMSHGSSIRWTCEAAEAGVACAYELPGGQRHHPDSPWFDDLFAAWLDNTPTPMERDLEVLRAASLETIRFQN
jgi:penicillin amidase